LLAHTLRRLALIGVDEVGRNEEGVGVLASSFPQGRKAGHVVALEDIELVQYLALGLEPMVFVPIFWGALGFPD
jgi:hypothetical protein